MRRMLACLFLVAVIGCQHGVLERPTSTTARQPAPQKSTEQVPARAPAPPLPDLGPVFGRVICLDPGHGGRSTGAVAPLNGLRESDVNLRVGLRLRDILQEAGARILLTRTDDRALDAGNASSDLTERSILAGREQADAFLSIHHNADIDRASQKNDLEVYYKFREDGASLDLAQSLTRALSLWLRRDAEAKRLLPGNYKVLRTSDVPAVLLESSYMTCDSNAAILATDAAIDAEARAIAAGLALHFSLDPPKVASAQAVERDEGRVHQLSVQFSRGLPIELDSIRVTLGSASAAGESSPTQDGFVWTSTRPLPNGNHLAWVRVRNSRGAAASFSVPVAVSRPPSHMHIEQRPPSFPRGSGIEIMFEVAVRDRLGLPIADGTGIGLRETRETSETKDGKARFYIPERGDVRKLTFTAGDICAEVVPTPGNQQFRTVRCVDSLTKNTLTGVVAASDAGVVVSTEEGWLALPVSAANVQFKRCGYETASQNLTASHTEVALSPVADGALGGKRIVIDPAYGGRAPGTIGPTGMRACDVNLDVALRVAALLRDAGSCVALTRDADSEMSDLQRLAVAQDGKADLFITISYGTVTEEARLLDETGHRRDTPPRFAAHYPDSANGTRLARAIAAELDGLPMTPCVFYLVQQTPCPAVLLQPAAIADAKTEDRYRDAEARRADASALYEAILEYFKTSP